VATLPVMVLAVGTGVDYAFYVYNRLLLHLAGGQPIAAPQLRVGVAGAAGAARGGRPEAPVRRPRCAVRRAAAHAVEAADSSYLRAPQALSMATPLPT
jgi:hypothetical protein